MSATRRCENCRFASVNRQRDAAGFVVVRTMRCGFELPPWLASLKHAQRIVRDNDVCDLWQPSRDWEPWAAITQPGVKP
jgi:hypothetical protein